MHGYSFSYLVHVCNRETRAAAAHTKLHTRHRSMARATYLAPEDGPGVVAELKGAAGRLRETRAAHRRVRDRRLVAGCSQCMSGLHAGCGGKCPKAMSLAGSATRRGWV